VKNRNNSSLRISGNDRNCSYCSRENIFSDTQPPPPRRNKPGQNVAEVINFQTEVPG